MNELKRQVRLAYRRLLAQRFLALLPWTLSVCLGLAALAIVATKIWPLPVQPTRWAFAWLGGAVGGGLLGALLLTWWRRTGELAAAIEIDQRFGLKERVSSCLALSQEQQTSEAGQALIDDALRRVQRLDIGSRFGLSTNRWAALPCGLAVLAFALTLLSDAQPDAENATAAAAVSKKEKQVVANSAQQLIKKSEELRKQAVEKGLEDAGDLFKKLEAGVDSLKQKQDVDRQQALVKLNDLAKEMQERKKELLSRDDLRKQLNSLKEMKSGPADRMAQAMKQGDFKAALDELRKLQEELKSDQLSAAEKQQLQEQMQQLAEKLQQMSDAHEQAKRELQEQIQQKVAQGDREAANRLQKQLDQLMQQEKQAQKMADMAQKLAQAAQAMKQGNAQQAAEGLGEMADSLDGMAQELAEMEMLETALDQIASAKDAMNCASCQGMGCSLCQGTGMDGMGMSGMGQGMGKGLGEGQGEGDRPEEQTKFGTYDSQVRSQPGKGRAVVSGTAFGANRPGEALEEIKSAIQAAEQGQDDPLTGQRLPKPQRELTREYFRSMTE